MCVFPAPGMPRTQMSFLAIQWIGLCSLLSLAFAAHKKMESLSLSDPAAFRLFGFSDFQT
jgi:hypothetical protein